eukprot:4847110-Amphidinium_carterae.1
MNSDTQVQPAQLSQGAEKPEQAAHAMPPVVQWSMKRDVCRHRKVMVVCMFTTCERSFANSVLYYVARACCVVPGHQKFTSYCARATNSDRNLDSR